MTPRRRAILAAPALLVPTACAPTPAPPATSTAPSPTPTRATTSHTPAPAPSPSPSPSPSPTPTGPSREEIVACYDGRAPSAWGMEMPGIVSTVDAPSAVLTLDACGGDYGSGVDQRILDALREHAIPATLFLNARWIEANPALAAELAADDLFELANHGTRHVPLSVTGRDAYGIVGTASAGEVFDEVMGNQAVLTELTGEPPRFFRSGTAHYDDVSVEIARDLGCIVAGFSVNADGGATLSSQATAQELMRTIPGSIILGHMNQPGKDAGLGYVEALPRLLGAGLHFAKLGDAVLS